LTLSGAMRLVFSFVLHDGIEERDVLRKINAGQIRGCSIGFKSEAEHYDWRHTRVYDRVRLTEISLCDGTSPAWYSTWVQARAQ
jgi:HK97 family phage prohead protease